LKKIAKRKDIKKLREMVEASGGIEYAKNHIIRISDEARQLLDVFPKSEYKNALNSALDFNIERIK
jgi:geranylgeranyl pyrophosphate synthase